MKWVRLALSLSLCTSFSALLVPTAQAQEQVSLMETGIMNRFISQAKETADGKKALLSLILANEMSVYAPLKDYNAAISSLKLEKPNADAERFLSHMRDQIDIDLGRQMQALPGAVTEFYVSFPFESSSLRSYWQSYEPESGVDTSKPSETSIFPHAPWRPYRSLGNGSAILPQEVVSCDDNGVLYLVTEIEVSKKASGKAWLEISSSTPMEAWVNGRYVAKQKDFKASPAPIFGSSYGIEVKEGKNSIAIKLAVFDVEPHLYVFLKDRKTGKALDFKSLFDPEKAIVIEKLSALNPKEKIIEKASIYEEMVFDTSLARAYRALAARRSLSSEHVEPMVRDLLRTNEGPEALATSSLNEILATILALEESWLRRDMLKQVSMAPNADPWLKHFWAFTATRSASDAGGGGRLVSEWPEIAKALDNENPSFIKLWTQAAVELSAIQPKVAGRILSKHASLYPNASILSLELSSLQSGGSDLFERGVKLEELYKIQQSSAYYLIEILALRLARASAQNAPEALETCLSALHQEVEAFLERHPYNEAIWDFWLDVAEHYGGRDTVALYERYISERPNDAERWKRYAAYALRQGDKENFLSSLELITTLKPLDEAMRARLEKAKKDLDTPMLKSATAFETPYVVKNIPANTDPNAVGIVSLLDNRVVRVLSNGLTSSFSQVAFEVLDEQGLRMIRNMPINYSPIDEKIEIISVTTRKKNGSTRQFYESDEYNVADESIRMYFDQRQIILSVADLAVGDIVEYQFKRTQIKQQSSSVPFFADNFQLQSTFNKQWMRYTVLAPKNFPIHFYYHAPKTSKHIEDTKTPKIQGDEKVLSFEERQMPRILPEAGMPGITEIVPFLLLSSFDSWQALAHWYIDLAKPQWVIDDAIRQKTQRLIAGSSDPMEKIQRIHNYVVKSTRYVALEFGIHGFKPYPVSQVFQRRFGDCKDKASLLKVMLNEAGIDANFVLTRTTQNGDIDSQFPSPYLFDHAIVYVPDFDLFLDGTAEFSGTKELPGLDQGALVLIVKDDGSYVLRKTPVSSPDDNLSSVKKRVNLAAGTTVVPLDYAAHYKGYFAPSYRERYQDGSQQIELLETELAYGIPGIKLQTATFDDISSLEKDVHLTSTAEVSLSDIAKISDTQLEILPLVAQSRIANFAPTSTRKLPLVFPVPMQFEEETTLDLPASASIVFPKSEQRLSPFGSYSINYRQEGLSITTTFKFELKVTRIEADEYADFQDFLQEIDSKLNTPLIIYLTK